MRYYGIDDQYVLAAETFSTLPSFTSAYTRSFIYVEDVQTMYYGTATGWVSIGNNQLTGYLHTQSVASDTWTVNHMLGIQDVVVTVYDSDHKVIMPDEIVANTEDQTIIYFSEAVAGWASVVMSAASTLSASFSTQQIRLPKGSSLANLEWKGTTLYGTNGEATTISQGQLCYCKLNGGTWKYYKYDANGTDKLILPTVIAAEDITSGSDGLFLMEGEMRYDSWSLSGTADASTTVYASATAGGLTMTAPATSGDEVIVAGFLIAASTIHLKIGYAWLEVK